MQHWMCTGAWLPRTVAGMRAMAKYLKRLGITHAAVTVNRDAPRTFGLIYRDTRYVQMWRALKAEGIQPVAIVWLHRDRQYIQAIKRTCLPWAESHGVWTLLDAEGYALAQRGVKPDAWLAHMTEAFWDWPVPLGMTSYPLYPRALHHLDGLFNFGAAQAYGIYKPDKPSLRSHLPIYRPGNMQRASIPSYTAHFDQVVVLLPLGYSQHHPDPHPKGHAAVKAQVREALRPRPGVVGVGWWSLPHLGRNGTWGNGHERLVTWTSEELPCRPE